MRENNGNIFEVHQEKNKDPNQYHIEPAGTSQLLRTYSSLTFTKQESGLRFPQYMSLYGYDRAAL